ncbi:hypothetical protein V9T40_000929 [Parthenolecanium corni]|uniref:Rad51-like C-terminal domain-containing protein n=1 Tax=Parthenolecanium corni TaxID=536013 RepID=A0AAN9Y242_9HEMI
MSNFRTESGIQLLARLKNSKQTLRNVDNVLFDEGLKETDVVALSAESNRLKNVMLTHLLKKATLSDLCGGSNSSILYIDTALTFNINHFASCLVRYYDNYDNEKFTDEMKQKMVENSLENVIFDRCYDSQQLFVTFQNLHTTLSSNTKIKLIVLDDVGSNYWQDFCSGGLKHMDSYEKKVVSVLQNSLKDFKVSILYVRPEFFVQKNPNVHANAAYNVKLTEKDKQVQVTVQKKSSSYSKLFTMLNGDVLWC